MQIHQRVPASRFICGLVLACESWITFEEVDMNVKNLVGYYGPCLGSLWQSQSQNGKLKVMTTFYPVYDFTKKIIVGDEGTVDLLIGRDQSLMNMNCLLRGG